MFNLKTENTASYKEVLDIYTQEEIFYLLLGYYPDYIMRYKSPFRSDRSAQCRFEKSGNWLYFIDNASFNGEIRFNCFKTASILWGIPIPEVCYKLLTHKKVYFPKFVPVDQQLFKCDIRIETEKWQEDDYFSQFEIPISMLNKACVFKVKNYWINSKYNSKLIKNSFGKKDVQIAYFFPETSNIKLYFPNEPSEHKWYSNTNTEDIFNWTIKDDEESDIAILTKSGKDALLMQHHFSTPTIALLNEQCFVPKKALEWLRTKSNVVVFYDNDYVGIECSNKISKQLTENGVSSIQFNNTESCYSEYGGKDASEIFSNREGFSKLKEAIRF